MLQEKEEPLACRGPVGRQQTGLLEARVPLQVVVWGRGQHSGPKPAGQSRPVLRLENRVGGGGKGCCTRWPSASLVGQLLGSQGTADP